MSAYYNEFDRNAAAWLRELIKRGLIADGEVDERSISDVVPADLANFTQCHFFAGIGVWSYALRQAGFVDDRPVWTGSCPCQPFSAAGKQLGHNDERHLWPAWFRLIRECRPSIIFGEQVEAAVKHGWLDLVQTDLEGCGYAVGAVVLPAAGVGAPHIRSRLWFVAESKGIRRQYGTTIDRSSGSSFDATASQHRACGNGESGRLAESDRGQRDGIAVVRGVERHREDAGWAQGGGVVVPCSEASGLADDDDEGLEGWRGTEERADQCVAGTASVASRLADAGNGSRHRGESRTVERGLPASVGGDATFRPGPTNGYWSSPDWIFCRDNKWRPVEPGLEPLAHGAPQRVVRLRAYGNAIVAPQAQTFIEAYLDIA